MRARTTGALLLAGIAGIAVGLNAFLEKQKGTSAMSPRERVVSAALAELGVQNPDKYWSEVLSVGPPYPGAWCGGFALWALHQAGLGSDIPWEIGKGFCYRLPTTSNPGPGDIAYIDQPYQHHAIVEYVDSEGVHTIDGNQKGETVQRRVRPPSAITAYYSIDPLLSNGTWV